MGKSKSVRRILRKVFQFGPEPCEKPQEVDTLSLPTAENGDLSWENDFLQEVFPDGKTPEGMAEDGGLLLRETESPPSDAAQPAVSAGIDALEKKLGDLKKSNREKNLEILKQEQIIQKSQDRLEAYQRRIRSLESRFDEAAQYDPASESGSESPAAEADLAAGVDDEARVKSLVEQKDDSPTVPAPIRPSEEAALREQKERLTTQNLLLQEALEDQKRIVSMLQKENRGLKLEQKAFLQELDSRGGNCHPQTLAVLASSFDALLVGYERTKGALGELQQATAALKESTTRAERNLAAERLRTTALERGSGTREAALLERLEEKVHATISIEKALKAEVGKSTDLENKLAQDKAEIARLLSREAELVEKQREHKREIAELEKMVEASNQIMGRLEENLKEKQTEITALESKVLTLLSDREKEICENQEQLRVCRAELSAAESRHRESMESRRVTELALQDQTARASQLEENFKRLYEEARIRELESERENGKREEQLQELLKKSATQEEECHRIRCRLEEKEGEILKLQNAFLEVEARLLGRENKLKEEMGSKEAEIRRLNDLVLQKKEKIEQLKFSLQHGFGTKNTFLTRWLPPLVWLVSLLLLSLYGFS